MNSDASLAQRDDIFDLQVSRICLSGDFSLQDGPQRLAENVTEQTKCHCQGQQPETPSEGFSSAQREPGQAPGQKRGSSKIRPTTGVDSEFAFAGAQARQRLGHRRFQVIGCDVSKDEETGWIGMSRQMALGVFRRKDVDRGVLESVVAASFKDEREV